MKAKGLPIAVVLLAMLGGATWWSNKKQAAAGKTPADTSTKVLSIPDDQFQEIKIKKLTGETLRLRRENGKWQMLEPKALPADQDAAASMVSSLSSLNADKVVEEKATDLKPYGLDTPTLDVSIVKKDGKTDELLIGDDTPTGSGSYARRAGDAKVVTIATFTKSSLDKRPDDLRDKRLMVFDSDKLTRVEVQAALPKGQQTVEFGKNGQNEWQILKPRPMRADGVYKVAADIADALDKGADDFRNKKLFDFGFSDPSKVDLKVLSYTKIGDKWMLDAKAMDNASVQTLIDKLRDLAAVKFVEKEGGVEVFTAAVTSNSGKRVEKVTITRQGNQ